MTDDPSPLEALHAAIVGALTAGYRVPCIDRPEWTSDLHDDLEEAARLCDGCPAQAECVALVDLEKWGTWGGRVVDPNRASGRRPRKAGVA